MNLIRRTRLLMLPLIIQCLLTKGLAQEKLIIQVLNVENDQGIAFANVYFSSSDLGKTTDLNGIAVFNKADLSEKDESCEVSFIGYVTQKIPILLFAEDTIVVRLTSALVNLPEIQVSSTSNKLNGRELIEESIKRIEENFPQLAFQTEGLYREMIYENGHCSWINEALLVMDYQPYPQKSYVRKSWKAYWNEQFYDEWLPFRQYRKTLPGGHPQFFKYYNSIEDKVCIISTRKSENLIQEQLEPELWSGPLGLTAADKVKFQADFLDPKLLDKYEYTRGAALLLDSIVCIAVNFKPVELSQRVHQMWQEKISFPLFAGTVYLDVENFAVVRFECTIANPKTMDIYQISDPWQIFPASIEVSVDYRKFDKVWLPRQLIIEQVLEGKSSEKWNFSNHFRIKRELFFNPGGSKKLKGIEFRDIHRANLRDFPVAYQPEIWEDFFRRGHYPAIGDQETKDLERMTPLEKQFMLIDRRY